MNFDTTLTDKMKKMVETTRLDCGVARGFGGCAGEGSIVGSIRCRRIGRCAGVRAGAWHRLSDRKHAILYSRGCPSRTEADGLGSQTIAIDYGARGGSLDIRILEEWVVEITQRFCSRG